MDALKHKTVSGVKWLAANNILQKVISVATFAVLARILSPSIFGLFAMAFIFIDALNLFWTLGVDGALIQRKEQEDHAKHTAFFMILGFGFLVFLACMVLAPVAGMFFRNESVVSVIRGLGIVYISGCLTRVPNAILTREMRFRLMSVIQLIGSIVNSVFAIIFALLYPSIWALVWAYLLKQLVMTVLSWYFSGYRVRLAFSPVIAKELSGVGKFMWGQTVFQFVSQNLDKIVVARMLGAISMGYYALAYNVSNFTQTHFVSLVSRVLFPTYSNIQHQEDLLKRAYLKALHFVAMVSIPYGFFLIFLAKEFVSAIYGPKWLEVIPLIQLFGFFQLFLPIFECSNPVFMGCGKPQHSYQLRLFGFLVKLPLIFILAKYFGLPGVIVAALGSDLLFIPLNYYWIRSLIGFTGQEFIKQLYPSLISALMMIGVIGVTKYFLTSHPLPMMEFKNAIVLGGFSLLAVFSYLAAFFVIDRSSVMEVKQMVLKLERS